MNAAGAISAALNASLEAVRAGVPAVDANPLGGNGALPGFDAGGQPGVLAHGRALARAQLV